MLRITLREGEKAVVNGAVLRAVGRTQFCVENQAAILRDRDVMRPEEADTAARQLYFACMLAYVDPEGREAHQDALVLVLSQVLADAEGDEARAACIRFAREAAQGDYYRALATARALIGFEQARGAPSHAAA